MSSGKKAKIALTLALLLLSLSGTAAGYAIIRLYKTEILVRHTYDVEVSLGDLESSLTQVGRSRVEYVNSGTQQSLDMFRDAVEKVPPALARIRQLTADNPSQQVLCDRLEANAKQRVDASEQSVELKQQNQSDATMQLQFAFEVAKTSFDTAVIAEQMKSSEDALLQQR